MSDTVAAIATPPGNGGIAVIRISGKMAYIVANKVFKPHNKNKDILNAKGYTAIYGEFFYRGKAIDQGIALFFRGPHSYTGEDVVELSCHGGGIISQEVLQACYESGAIPANAGEFTKRAVLNGRISLTQAEAVMDLISASSRQGAAAAKAALSGVLFEIINIQKLELIKVAGHLTAYIDYPDEGVDEPEFDSILNIIKNVKMELKELINGYDKGAILRRGIKAVIVGSPNVGKSTLFNLLFGVDRAIVTSIAGTTRDIVREEIDIGGIPLLLSDTAGLHETNDIVEAEGIRRSFQELEQAGLIIAVFDGSIPLNEKDMELIKQCKNKPALGIINKCDLNINLNIMYIEDYFTKTIMISARNIQSRNEVENAILEILNINEIDPDTAMLANERQLSATIRASEALNEAEEALRQGVTLDAADVCIEDAISSLSEISGENMTDSVLEEVFSKFCVGK